MSGGAVSLNLAPMHLDKPVNDREANAKPALRAVEGAIGLGEKLKDMGENFRGHADASIPYSHQDVAVLDLR